MYLMDSIATVAATALRQGNTNPVLSIFPDFVRRMAHAPRFLLDNGAVAASVELTLGRPKILREAMAHVRVPYQRMWVEWDEHGRDNIRREYEKHGVLDIEQPGRPLPARLGFLIEAEEGGRRGTATWAWSSRQIDVPSIAPIVAYFDLDNDFPIEQPRVETLLSGNLGSLWKDSPIQLDAFFGIWRTAQHKPSEWGREFIRSFASSQQLLEFALANFISDVYGEYIGIWSIIMLLTANRQAVDLRPVSRDKLNKARARKRETPLLDHTEVVLHVNRQYNAGGLHRAPLGHDRKSPRIHMVSRYLARRGDKHWIVEPYIRGSGDSVERYIHVRA